MIYDLNKLTGKLEPYDRKGARYPDTGRSVSTDDVGPDLEPALCCTLFRKENGIRAVTVTEGKVIEVLPRFPDVDSDSIIEHPIAEIFGEDGLLKEHTLEHGECIGVAFNVDENGYVDAESITLDVRGFDDIKSAHYEPPVGPSEGSSGSCFYVLARLMGNADIDYLETYHGGSNIDYVHDLAPFKKETGSAGEDIFTKYDIDIGAYRYKGVRGESPISVDADGVDLIVKLAAEYKKNLNLKIMYFTVSNQSVTVTLEGETGTTPTGGGDPEPDGAHNHSLSITGASATIASLTLNGTTGTYESSEFTAEPSGEHYHALGEHVHYYEMWDDSLQSNVSTLSGPGLWQWQTGNPTFVTTGSAPSATDGAHSHAVEVSGSSISFTFNYSDTSGASVTGGAHQHAVKLTGNISVPQIVVDEDNYDILFWRKGLYVGKGNQASSTWPTADGPVDEVTIHVYKPTYTP